MALGTLVASPEIVMPEMQLVTVPSLLAQFCCHLQFEVCSTSRVRKWPI